MESEFSHYYSGPQWSPFKQNQKAGTSNKHTIDREKQCVLGKRQQTHIDDDDTVEKSAHEMNEPWYT